MSDPLSRPVRMRRVTPVAFVSSTLEPLSIGPFDPVTLTTVCAIPGLRKFEQMAEQLATAYSAGDVETIREFNRTYGTSFVWDREPAEMHR
jgi:hypothetical protein